MDKNSRTVWTGYTIAFKPLQCELLRNVWNEVILLAHYMKCTSLLKHVECEKVKKKRCSVRSNQFHLL